MEETKKVDLETDHSEFEGMFDVETEDPGSIEDEDLLSEMEPPEYSRSSPTKRRQKKKAAHPDELAEGSKQSDNSSSKYGVDLDGYLSTRSLIGSAPSDRPDQSPEKNDGFQVFDTFDTSSIGSSVGSFGSSFIQSDNELETNKYEDDDAFWRAFREKATGEKYNSDDDSDSLSGSISSMDSKEGEDVPEKQSQQLSAASRTEATSEKSTISSKRRKLLAFRKRVRKREKSLVYDYAEALFALVVWTVLAIIFLQMAGRPDWLKMIYQRELLCISIPVMIIVILFLVELYHDSRAWNRGSWRIGGGDPSSSPMEEPKTPDPEVFRPF